MSDHIGYDVKDQVAIVTINRPEKRNALTIDMITDLARAYGRYARDASARCLVLRASGETFCSGLDLKSGAGRLATDGGSAFLPPGAVDPAGILTPRVQKPVVTAIRGACYTAGIELALAGDIIIAASDAKFAQLEVTRGIMAFWGATVRMPQAIGWHNAMRWILTGDTFGAGEAWRMGLVQEVVQPGEEFDCAMRIARRICEAAPMAVQASLRTAMQARTRGEPAASDTLYPEAAVLAGTEDARLGAATYLDRVRPVYSGG